MHEDLVEATNAKVPSVAKAQRQDRHRACHEAQENHRQDAQRSNSPKLFMAWELA